jgi:hypothetical protein
MPTVAVQEPVTLQQAATALKDKLGSRYEVTTHGSGADEALTNPSDANETRAFPAPVEPPPSVS